MTTRTENLNALVLNADWMPVSLHPLSIWSFEDTIRKVLAGRARVVETHDVEFWSQDRRHVWRPPSVVALVDYIRPRTKVKFSRRNIYLRDDMTCQYCGCELGSENAMTFDHVIPRCKGGGTTWENIVAACAPCNARKGHGSHMKPMRPPRKPSAQELQMKRGRIALPPLHRNAIDYLYWCGALEEG